MVLFFDICTHLLLSLWIIMAKTGPQLPCLCFLLDSNSHTHTHTHRHFLILQGRSLSFYSTFFINIKSGKHKLHLEDEPQTSQFYANNKDNKSRDIESNFREDWYLKISSKKVYSSLPKSELKYPQLSLENVFAAKNSGW